jgi:hypothetical protein
LSPLPPLGLFPLPAFPAAFIDAFAPVASLWTRVGMSVAARWPFALYKFLSRDTFGQLLAEAANVQELLAWPEGASNLPDAALLRLERRLRHAADAAATAAKEQEAPFQAVVKNGSDVMKANAVEATSHDSSKQGIARRRDSLGDVAAVAGVKATDEVLEHADGGAPLDDGPVASVASFKSYRQQVNRKQLGTHTAFDVGGGAWMQPMDADQSEPHPDKELEVCHSSGTSPMHASAVVSTPRFCNP